MKKKVYVVASVVIAFLIIAGVMLSMKMNNKNVQSRENIGKAEEIQEESNIQALETEPQVPENWDLTKVTPVLSEDNIYVPVPIGWSISCDENERYVNGNVTKKGTISNLTFTGAGDYPWTQNSDNIWVSGNTGVTNSTSELVSNEIEVGESGGLVQIEWSVSSKESYDILSMTIYDTVNGNSEQISQISGSILEGTKIPPNGEPYKKLEKELSTGKYTISIVYSKNDADIGGYSEDKGYVKSGRLINYSENGEDELKIYEGKGGFVIYEGTEAIDDLWTASKTRNQFVWVPVENASSRIYESNSEKDPKKARLWDFSRAGRGQKTQNNGARKMEPGIASYGINKSVLKKYIGLQDYSNDIWYKEVHLEFERSMESIEKYGGFYIGRYETGDISKSVPVVKRLNTDLSGYSWEKVYNKMRKVSTNPNIQSGIIWGCLWDETLQWLVDSGSKTYAEIHDSTGWGNHNNATFKYLNKDTVYIKPSTSTIIPTGSSEYTKANNIYDLAGNYWDVTNESSVVARGGCFRTHGNSDNANSTMSSMRGYSAHYRQSLGTRFYYNLFW